MNFSMLMFDTAVAPFLADAQASSGPDGVAFAAGGAALGAFATLAGAWIKARFSRTAVVPDPVRTEASAQQDRKDQNDEAHADLFGRMRVVEAEVAALKAETRGVQQMQARMFDMISALYERIIGGKK